MLLWVAGLLAVVPVGRWTVAVMTDPTRFVDAVADLPGHRIVRRAVIRHSAVGRLPLSEAAVGRLLRSPLTLGLWTRGAAVAHRRLRRPCRRAALVVLAALGVLCTPHGRWRAAAWLTGIGAAVTTIWAIANL